MKETARPRDSHQLAKNVVAAAMGHEPAARVAVEGTRVPPRMLTQVGATRHFNRDDIHYEIMVYADPKGFHAVWQCQCRIAGRSSDSSPTTEMAIDAAKVNLRAHHLKRHG
jgi:hypothetical protein